MAFGALVVEVLGMCRKARPFNLGRVVVDGCKAPGGLADVHATRASPGLTETKGS